MRPLVIQVVTAPIGGGAEYLVRELTQRLPNYGLDSQAIYFSKPVVESSGFELRENEFILASAQKPRSPLLIAKLNSLLKQRYFKKRPLLIHSHLTWPFFYVPIATACHNIPLVYTEHDSSNGRRQYRVLKPLDSFFYQKYQRIFCISHGVQASLHEWVTSSKERSQVIMNGSRLFEWKQRVNVQPHALKLISVGSLIKKKGFDIAIKAISEVRECIAEYRIIGEGAERGELQRLIDKLQLQEIVTLPGWSDDVEKEYQSADLQLIPSRWEGFGLVVVEGMSTGLPVLAADVPGLNEILRPYRSFQPLIRGDFRDWANTLKVFIDSIKDDLLHYDELSQHMYRQSQMFSLDRMTELYAEAYHEVIDSFCV